VPPTASAENLHSVMREDVIEPSLSIEDALFNANHYSQNQFKIQAVLDENS
jgi:Asp-tRNA(Asn)/Glu-tRNA(Gln) amidotransferase C subunit